MRVRSGSCLNRSQKEKGEGMRALLLKGQNSYYLLTAMVVTWLVTDTAEAQATVVGKPMQWIKENIMEFVNSDLWQWVAMAGVFWQFFLWYTNKRTEHIVWACFAGVFGMLWAMRADIMASWGVM
jgi:hypothetical protein